MAGRLRDPSVLQAAAEIGGEHVGLDGGARFAGYDKECFYYRHALGHRPDRSRVSGVEHGERGSVRLHTENSIHHLWCKTGAPHTEQNDMFDPVAAHFLTKAPQPWQRFDHEI